MFYHWVDYTMRVLFEVRILIEEIWFVVTSIQLE